MARAVECQGPNFELAPTEAARGGTIEVVGRFFGTSCYDTGPPPPGLGILGAPQQDLEVLVVQGDREVVVATGDADTAYRFAIEIVVPPDLEPGPARLVVRMADGTDTARWNGPDGFTVTDAPPTGAAVTVTDFNIAHPVPEPPPAVDGSGGPDLLWLSFPAVAVAVVAARVVTLLRRR